MVFDAVSFLTDYNIDFSTEGKNVQENWIGIQCPVCGDHSNHGGFSLDDGHYYCWRCGSHKVNYIIGLLLNCGRRKAEGIEFNYSDKFLLIKKRKKIRAKKIELRGNNKLLSIDKRYLIKRGFDPVFIQNKYKIRGSEIAGEWRFRIIIPVFYNKQIVTFQGRDVSGRSNEGNVEKYKSLEVEKSILDVKSTLYGIDDCIGYSTVVVVEGVFDKWRMGGSFVASFGKGLTDIQLKLLLQFDRIFFLIDSNDPFSKQFAVKNCLFLSGMGKECYVFDMENGKDPGALTEKEALEVRKEMKL